MDIQFLMEMIRKNGYDQKRFAQALGVQPSKITKIKQGKYLGSFQEFEQIVEILHLNAQQAYRLLTGHEGPEDIVKKSEVSVMAKEIDEKSQLIKTLEDEIQFLREQNRLLIQSLTERNQSSSPQQHTPEENTSRRHNSENNRGDTGRHSAGRVNLAERRHTSKKA